MTQHFDSPMYPIVEAIYRPSSLPDHAGNALIEALPPYDSDEEALASICWQPHFSPEERAQPIALRIARLIELRRLMIPLERHCEALYTLNAMLRSGYVSRPPNSPERARTAQTIYELQQSGKPFRQAAESSSVSLSTALIGLPGMGKTTLVDRWCEVIPKAIYHPKQHIYQVPILKADAPSDGTSIKGFCHALLHELDARIPGTDYYREYAVRGRPGADSMLKNVVRLMNIHCLGMLIIDEAQNFANAHKNGEIVMTEIVSAFNALKAPVVLMGTNKAYAVFERDFRSARRAVSIPLQHWDRMRPNARPDEDEWTDIVQKLWEFQWTREPVELDEWTLQVLYDCSQGVIAILVALYAAAQTRAMLDRSETLTPDVIREVYQSQFTPIHPMIDALRDNDGSALQRYLDIAPPLHQALDQVWSYGVSPSSAQSMAGLPAASSAAIGSPGDSQATQRRPARIRSRVPEPRTARTKKSRQKPAEVDYPPDDYRHGRQAALRNQTSVHDELIRLDLMPSTEEVLNLFE